MSEEARADYEPPRQMRVPCVCAGTCQILVVAEWDDDPEDDDTFLEFYTRYRQDRWRHRLKNAWRSLTGEPYYHDIMISKRQARELGAFLRGDE